MFKKIFLLSIFTLSSFISSTSIDEHINSLESQSLETGGESIYGRNVHRLSFEEVRTLIDSMSFYKGRMSKQYFKKNAITSYYHPFSLQTLIQCIINSSANDHEKEALWSLLLTCDMAYVTLTFNEYGSFEKASIDYTLKSSCLHGIKRLTMTKWEERKDGMISACSTMTAITFAAACFLRIAYLDTFHSHTIVVPTHTDAQGNQWGKKERKFNEGVFFWNRYWTTISILLGIYFGYRLESGSSPLSASYKSDAEKLFNRHCEILDILNNSIADFPSCFMNNLKTLQEQLNACKDENKDKRETDKKQLELLLEYHDDLVEKSESA
ncbi:hypothetical protein FJ366_02160 [Candidatus Dependentiae bacterium]|nr:hypothetical protein [Candidatus Dependentiae bacterium]